MTINNFLKEASSFRDKSAAVGYINGKLVRKIYSNYMSTFEKVISSGLYKRLLSENLIIRHKIVSKNANEIIILPKKIFISYPWEWSFTMLKDAALTTLKIQKIALEYDFILKDANCFNIQFYNNKPLLIDTTSFAEYKNNSLWEGYKQFCTNFLSPLLLMAYKDLKLQDLILGDISGIDLNLTSKLLPLKTWFNFYILSNVHLHAIFSKKYSKSKEKISEKEITKEQMSCFIDFLISAVENIKLTKQQTQWSKYYTFTNYNKESFEDKKEKVLRYSSETKPKTVLDFGSNIGYFSKLFKTQTVYSLDMDRLAVEYNYLDCKKNNTNNIFPMVFDIMNPSPSLGFLNKERLSLLERLKSVDLILALALTHHLRISNNLPFENQARFFSNYGKYLIVEYIDKTDSKIQQMLLNRKDIFDDYTNENFEKEFSAYFDILKKENISSGKRILYLMKNQNKG